MSGMDKVDAVWERIVAHQGQVFRQMRGKEFTYSVKGNVLRPSATNRNIPRSDFEKALDLMPLHGPGEINRLQGPSYIFAILKDPRICG